MKDMISISEPPADCTDSEAEWNRVYNDFIAKLNRAGVAQSAPKVGDIFPDFVLPDEFGRYRQLSALVRERPTVLSFNRGGWCPYCRGELSAWADQSAALIDAGGGFLVVTAEVGGRAAALRELVGSNAQILCDIDHGVAMSLGLTFRCDEDLQNRYLACGLDLADLYGGDSWFLPVPATFVIGRNMTVHFAFADPDFRVRAEPADVIATLAQIS